MIDAMQWLAGRPLRDIYVTWIAVYLTQRNTKSNIQLKIMAVWLY